MGKLLHYFRKTMYLPIIIMFMLVASLILVRFDIVQLFKDYFKLITSESILTSDYVTIAGLGATLFNAATVLIFNLVIIRVLDLRLSGTMYAAIMMIFGYCFYGKNVPNTIPVYLGVYLYSKINKIKFKNLILSLLFSSGIAPLVSFTIFGIPNLHLAISIPLGILFGIVAGFVIPPLASHTMKVHQGYNLFNTGFSIGIIGLLFYGGLKSFGINFDAVKTTNINTNNHLFFVLMTLGIILIYTIMSFVCDKEVLKKLKELNKRSGRLVSDFERDFGVDAVLLNTAIILLLELALVLIFNIKLNGAIFGTMIAVCGFAGSGMHFRNTLPIMLGALGMTIVMNLVTGTAFVDIFVPKNSGLVIAILFSLCLAPIAGRYGVLLGLLAGMLHVIIVPICLTTHGGLNLYNNGFAGGFVACALIAVIEALKEER